MCYEKGYIFIDRDPLLFSVILTYLRESIVEIPKDVSAHRLENEFAFYLIDVPHVFGEQTVDENPLFGYAAKHRARASSFLHTNNKYLLEILKTQILKGNIKPHITWEWCAQHGEYVEEHGLNSRITKELISLIDNPACLDELTKIWNEQGFNVSLNYSARSSSLVFSSPKYQTPTIINR
eukprot:TRINITY_DN5404_c0_g1_i3.p1 TRINITY_DN5404_c0_g1~~TRINITY_DN5404_c0_g1_i3.p1  ORF type:complete len:180 (+),score=11.37 TRINITY_DN5404_c0_g1_i3:222-761(+)